MVYIRTKSVKGNQYLYLVHSVWDSKKATSRQEIVKYLGKASTVTKNDIPAKYRNDEKISSFFSSFKPEFKNYEKLVSKFRKNLLKSLQQGDLEECLEIYFKYRKVFGTTKFFESILKPVMYEVGQLWQQKKISIGTEHVCSNVAQNLITLIKEKNSVTPKKKKVLICTPSGEEHCIGCNVLESYLKCKGFHVFNLSPSAPATSIISEIEMKKPDVVLVSITIEDNLKSGQRLVNKIKEQYNIPVIVGGQAVMDSTKKFNAIVPKADSLDSVARLIKTGKTNTR